jgi:hypothetical protein
MVLAGRKHQFDRIAQSVDERMNLGRQSAARSADRLRAVFFRAPALCWWARTMVASIIMYSLSGALDNVLKSPPIEALVSDFPVTETLRQIAPRNADSIAVDNGVDEQPVIGRGPPHMTFAPRKKILDPFPLLVA